jgi:diguanylate cyclase (GGDEF)-like protein
MDIGVQGKNKLGRSATDRTAWVLAALGAFIALGFCSLCATVLLNERRDVWAETAKDAMNLALATARDIDRNIEILNLSLGQIADTVGDPGIQALPDTLKKRVLLGRAGATVCFGAIDVLDGDGLPTLTSDLGLPDRVAHAQADYFRAQVERDAGLFIARPHQGYSGQTLGLTFSRRITGADGRFAGVVVGSLQRDCFDQLFGNIALGPHGTISVMLTDGSLVARQSAIDTPGRPDSPIDMAFRRAMGSRGGLLEAKSRRDGIDRLYAFTQVGNLPLIVSVGYAISDIYAGWWRKSLPIASCIVLLCGATIAFAAQLWREFRRRHAAEAELAIIARTDVLTKLDNRRSFDEALDREWRRAIRTDSALSLCLIDIDYFKSYNDHYGHQAGDEVLRLVAETIAGSLDRPGDLGARYGGEEFAVLLPDTPSLGAQAVAEHIRLAIETLCLPHQASPTEFLTVSVGVDTVQPRVKRQQADLIRRADLALYRAKELGRNRIEVAQQEASETPPVRQAYAA